MQSSHNSRSTVIVDVGDFKELQRLVISAKNGDKQAFGKIYERLLTPLYRYVFSRSHDVELSHDICQQVFLKFYGMLSSYEPRKTPLAYLFTIAKRLLINHHEKKSFISLDENLLNEIGDERLDILEETHTKYLANKINGYLEFLTQDEDEVIRLFFYAELSHKEVAEVLEKDEQNIRKIKERAIKKLQLLTKDIYENS